MLQLSRTAPPKVSILMSVYNREFAKIERALDSVLKQDFTDFELIIIDDGSTLDISQQILNYATNHEDKLIYMRRKNAGQPLSINQAILNSRSPFIGFIDSDDEYKPNHISACLAEMDECYDLIASVSETIVNKEEDYYVPDKNDETVNIHVDECILFGTLFGKREVFLNTGFKDIYSADSDFFERAGKVYKTKKLNLKTYIYYLGFEDSVVSKMKKGRAE